MDIHLENLYKQMVRPKDFIIKSCGKFYKKLPTRDYSTALLPFSLTNYLFYLFILYQLFIIITFPPIPFTFLHSQFFFKFPPIPFTLFFYLNLSPIHIFFLISLSLLLFCILLTLWLFWPPNVSFGGQNKEIIKFHK